MIVLNDCCINNNNALCNDCNVSETVYHFSIKCEKYVMLRQFYIFPIYQMLQDKLNEISLKDLLFPPTNLK